MLTNIWSSYILRNKCKHHVITLSRNRPDYRMWSQMTANNAFCNVLAFYSMARRAGYHLSLGMGTEIIVMGNEVFCSITQPTNWWSKSQHLYHPYLEFSKYISYMEKQFVFCNWLQFDQWTGLWHVTLALYYSKWIIYKGLHMTKYLKF